MTDSTSSGRLRLPMLCALYFAQGIPWGFVSVAMLAWLNRPALKVSAETSGAILGVATLPWSFKFVWGPIIDAVRLPGGRRKPWIVLSQFLGVLWLALLLVIPEPESLIHYGESSSLAELFPGLATFIPGPLAWLILLTNIFISMQDVATDALAVESLSEEERGRANGLMYGSSYFGTAAGGAGLGWLTAAFGLRAGVAGYAVLLIAVGLLVVFVRETSLLAGTSTDAEPTDSGQADPAQKGKRQPNLFAHVGELALTFIVESLKLRFVFAIAVAFVCKIGIGTLTIILADFLQKQGGWSDTEYTSVTGGTAVMAGLVGSIGGGFVADFVGKRRLAAAGCIFVAILWGLPGWAPSLLQNARYMTGVLVLQEFAFGVLTVALFALFMGQCFSKVAATQFTMLMSMMNLSTTTGSYLAGQLSEHCSVPQIFLLSAGVQLLTLPLLLGIPPHDPTDPDLAAA